MRVAQKRKTQNDRIPSGTTFYNCDRFGVTLFNLEKETFLFNILFRFDIVHSPEIHLKAVAFVNILCGSFHLLAIEW